MSREAEEQIKRVFRLARLFDDSGLDEIDKMAAPILEALLDRHDSLVTQLLTELVEKLEELEANSSWRNKDAEAEYNKNIKNWR